MSPTYNQVFVKQYSKLRKQEEGKKHELLGTGHFRYIGIALYD